MKPESLLFLVALCAGAHSPLLAQEKYEWGITYPTADSYHETVRQPNPRCGRFARVAGSLGPMDYRKASPYTIYFVEIRHFTRDVELLKRGKKATVGGDLHFMLNVFPNHPRALRSASELLRRSKGKMPEELNYGFDCWFDRAISYRPDDPDVRIVYATELIKDGRLDDARTQTVEIEPLIGDNPRLQYNLGLIYFDLKEYDRAQELARKAYAMGIDFPGLRDKLKRVGKWTD